MSTIDPDIYSFFVSFENYNEYEQEMNVRYSKNKDNTTCEEFAWNTKIFGDENANDICIKFKILRKVILFKKKGRNSGILDNKDYSYLNYWLNNMSKNATGNNNLTVKQFQDTMGSVEGDFVGVALDKKLYDLPRDHYNNMILLKELYIEYVKIFEHSDKIVEGNTACIGYFKKYIDTYKKCIIKCPDDTSSFCKALKGIKAEYEKIYLGKDGISEKCPDKKLTILPTFKDVSTGDNITFAGSIVGPSFGMLLTLLFLYKFTPFGQWIHTKLGRNKGEYNNLYEENSQSFLNTSDNEDINFDENAYSISYDSLVNS
ncbi:PIR Superfamily Protein [Plasmodium ovale wallikeri]|uniref:PIR Superfamily Protein n=1 Tax=Plasmodium ovale wallikeri TaxID=864142 RepID=A0A1A9AI38_PLAOA|nr:PIR Superfamily Protein [Plasmodium ovale wallikeri]SBT56365.1 PIR Superfamily Protein [Plasmodium ovale wallikeri]